MLFSKDIERLYEDGFDGSNEERQIFMEVFYGSSAGNATNSCHITGATNFEVEASRPINALVCSNSENSVLTAQSSVKDLHVEGSCTISDDVGHVKRNHVEISRGVTGSGCAQECSTANLGRDEHRVAVKRMRCSGDELSTPSNKYSNDHLLCAERDLIQLNSGIDVVRGMLTPDSHSNDPTIMCHLVETSSQGIIRGCYLHKQHREVDNRVHLDDGEASNHQPLSLIGKNANEVSDSTAIVSLVSQHIISPKDLVGDAFDAHKSEHRLVPLESSQEPLPDNSDIINITPKKNILKDLNLRLRSHINNLLIATGWCLEKQKKVCRNYFDTVYISPAGKIFRQFHSVWKACGESLFVGRYKMIREENVKQWVGISDYSSDLSDTLSYIEKDMQPTEPSFALAHLWSVLDPYATAVLIGKQIGAIRKGKPVNVHRTVVVDSSKGKDIVASTNVAGEVRDQLMGSHLTEGLVSVNESGDATPSIAGSTEVVNGNEHRLNEQCRKGSFSGFGEQRQEGAVKALQSVSPHKKDENTECIDSYIVDASVNPGVQREEFRDQSGSLSCNLVPIQKSILPGIVVDTCLYDAHVLSETVNTAPRNMLPQDGNDASVSSFREQTTGSVESVEDGKHEDTQSEGESMKRTINQLQVSLQDQLHISNDIPVPVGRSTSIPRHFDTCMHCNSLVTEAVQTMVKAIENACNQKGDTETFSAHCQQSCRSHLQVQSNSGGSKRPDGEDSALVKKSPAQQFSPKKLEPSGHLEDEGSRDSEVSNLEMERASAMVENSLMKKTRKKSKKISEIKVTKIYKKCSKLALSTPPRVDPRNCQEGKTRRQSRKVQMFCEGNASKNECHENSLSVSSSQHQIANGSRFKNIKHQDSGSEQLVVLSDDAKYPVKPNFVNHTDEALVHANSGFVNSATCRKNTKSKKGRKRLQECQIDDDDLLIAAIIINKEFSSNSKQPPLKPCKSKAAKKLKNQKGSYRLLPRTPGKGGKLYKDGKWSSTGARTVLSWLVDVGVIPLNDVIQFRSLKDDTVIKDGWVTKDGILCKCCSKVLSVSEFKVHAGFKLYKPCLNLFLESGKSYTLCLLQAWSAEYKTRKGGKQAIPIDEVDQNDDTCGLCGDGGELICCDNCPSTFHQTCLSAQELPEGSWYCPNCTCEVCGDVATDKEASSSLAVLKCTQCDHKYHGACIKDNHNCKVVSDKWFCGAMCQEIYTGFCSRVGNVNLIDDGFSWTLLRCLHGDQKVRSAQRFALMAECNSKLAVALTIMEECFLSMVDPRTGINMIPQVIYNWGSNFARLNFQGFYTAILEKEDEIISVATIRVHGLVAEMPLVATRTEHRRQGMCRQLINAVEEFLTSLKVERLIVAAIPSLVDTWTFGFGFEPVEDKEREQLNSINLMVFPGTTLLTKNLYYREATEIQDGPGDASTTGREGLAKGSVCVDQKVIQEAGSNMPALLDLKKMQLEEEGSSGKKHISTSFELPVSNFGRNEQEIVSNVERCRPRIVTSDPSSSSEDERASCISNHA